MSKAIIRCLFGFPGQECYWSKRNVQQTVALKNEIKNSLKFDWARRDIVHYVLGKENANLLKQYGAKKIKIIDDNPNLVPNDGVNPLYNKVYLINEAMKDYDEILFLDFDTVPLKGVSPDNEMWEILRSKSGKYNGDWQAPFVRRTRPFCMIKGGGGYRDPKKDFIRKTLTTCMVYCKDRNWIQEWLDHFILYQEVNKENGFKVLGKHDEYIFMYYLDKEKGVMNEEQIVDAFEPEIVNVGRAYVDALKKKKIYFKHD